MVLCTWMTSIDSRYRNNLTQFISLVRKMKLIWFSYTHTHKRKNIIWMTHSVILIGWQTVRKKNIFMTVFIDYASKMKIICLNVWNWNLNLCCLLLFSPTGVARLIPFLLCEYDWTLRDSFMIEYYIKYNLIDWKSTLNKNTTHFSNSLGIFLNLSNWAF